jgi:VanZ family protein
MNTIQRYLKSYAIGHIMSYGGLTLLWIWALVAHYPKRTAILIAAGIGLVLGIGGERSQQFIIERGTTVLDMAANIMGICFAAVLAPRTRAEPTP